MENLVANVLDTVIGDYLVLDRKQLKLSVLQSWLGCETQGKVKLKNVRLRTEALSKLLDTFGLDSDLPVNVKAGIVGEIQLEVPWRHLNKQPVVRPAETKGLRCLTPSLSRQVLKLDRVFLLAGKAEHKDEKQEALSKKLASVRRAETAWVAAEAQKAKAGQTRRGFVSSMIDVQRLVSTVIGNIKLEISNIHIRLESEVGDPSRPVALGLTVER
eukprot:392175-Prorocentrum_minimum.AAC.3